jgi:histone deacetylase 6
VRPPGHHAHCADIGGFCFFNNVAVAARVAQKEFNKRKVVIFDWDVHVGDGTANVFYNDSSVLYISIHRYDMGKFFPGPLGKLEMIGECQGRGYNLQFPFNLPQKTTGTEDDEQQTIGDSDYIFVCE